MYMINIFWLFLFLIILLFLLFKLQSRPPTYQNKTTEYFGSKSKATPSKPLIKKKEKIGEKIATDLAVRAVVNSSKSALPPTPQLKLAAPAAQQQQVRLAAPAQKQQQAAPSINASIYQQKSSSNDPSAQDLAALSQLSKQTVEFMVQADDSFECVFNGQVVSTGSNWNQVYQFSIPNVQANDKIQFAVRNSGGPGSLRLQFTYGGRTFFGDASNLTVLGKQPEFNGPIIGNRYMGCFQDLPYNRDLPMSVGFMSKDQCMLTAYNNNMPFYGVQSGGHCFIGGSYGRWGGLNEANCRVPCSHNPSETCGGSGTNSIFSVRDRPSLIYVDPVSNPSFDARARAVWVQSDGTALGRWLFELTVPSLNKLNFCPDYNYAEFNPAGCLNARNAQNCKSSVLPNYHALFQTCGKKYDTNDPDLFFMVMNRVFGITYDLEAISKESTQKKMTDSNLMARLKAKKLMPPKQGFSSGSLYLTEFLESNFRMLGLLAIIGKRINYPMDPKQMVGRKLVLPDSPMYYALVKRALQFSGKERDDPVSKMFMDSFNKTYLLARIIVGTPTIARECSCLGLSLANSQQCVPC
jgi:hypothetical protein